MLYINKSALTNLQYDIPLHFQRNDTVSNMETIPSWSSIYFTYYFHGFQKLNFSKRTSFYQIRCIKITYWIHDDIKNVGYEKVSWYWKFKIIFKDLRCSIDVFLLRFLHRKGEIHTCSSAQLIIRSGKSYFRITLQALWARFARHFISFCNKDSPGQF